MPSIYLGHKAFVDAGHEVLFAVPGPRARTYQYDGIQVREFRLPVPIVPQRYPWLHRLSLKVRWLAFLVVATIVGLRLGRRFRPDVVYGQFYPAAPVAWLLGRIWKVPNITRMYGTFLFPFVRSRFGRLRKFDEVLAFKIPCSYLIITNDGTRGAECAAALGVPAERIRFWRNGVDRALFERPSDTREFRERLSIPPDHKVILAVSRLVDWKRVDRLLSALPAVLDRCPDTTTLIVGDGDERPSLERLSLQLGVQDRVRFVGLVPHADVPRFMHLADLFVSLYDLSNAGNPLLEALCCGKCVVSLNNGGTGEINREAEVGVLLEEDELARLPAVIAELLRDDVQRHRFEQAARAYAGKHIQTWKERMQMEVTMIKHLVGDSHTRIGAHVNPR
jgi:glycosyltransferase involved in cell wall biosynthesis